MVHDFDDVKEAIKDFEKKFKDKTKNNWKDRANFVPKGLYSMVAMDGNDETDPTSLKRASKPAEPKKKKKSKNDKPATSQLDDHGLLSKLSTSSRARPAPSTTETALADFLGR